MQGLLLKVTLLVLMASSYLPKVDLTNLGVSSLFGSRKQSQTQILCKKIDIVTSPHIEEPQWDIIMDITDELNNDSGRAKRVLLHLKRILENEFQICPNNQPENVRELVNYFYLIKS